MLLKKIKPVIHSVSNTQLEILPEKAVYWRSESLLLVSDIHWGKVDHFRKNGIPIPGHASLSNYMRLSNLIDKVKPKEILFLGDIFHSTNNMDWQVCKTFLASYTNIALGLVKGNHDIISEKELSQVFHTVYPDSVERKGFLFSHEPLDHPLLYNICGHIHPAFRVLVKRQPSLRLPCFHFTPNRCTMPAFGTFTGMHVVSPSSEDIVYIIADEEVIRCP